jgi:hypothetical protein
MIHRAMHRGPAVCLRIGQRGPSWGHPEGRGAGLPATTQVGLDGMGQAGYQEPQVYPLPSPEFPEQALVS